MRAGCFFRQRCLLVDRGAFRHRCPDLVAHRLRRCFADERPHLALRVDARADLDVSHLFRKPRHEVVVDRGVNQEPIRGDAGLARVSELGRHRGGHGFVDVRVSKDHETGIPTELHRHSLDRVAGLGHEEFPDPGGPGEGYFLHVGIGAELGSYRRGCFGAGRDQFQNAVRDPGPVGQVFQGDRRQRRQLGRLDDGRAPGSERRAHLAGDHCQGEIPGRHHRRNAHGLLYRQDLPLRTAVRTGEGRGDHEPAPGPGRTNGLRGVVIEEGPREADLPVGFRQRLSGFQRHDGGEIVRMVRDQAAPPREEGRPVRGRGFVPPGPEGVGAFPDGGPGVAGGNLRQDRARGGGIEDLEACLVGRGFVRPIGQGGILQERRQAGGVRRGRR
mmetsp:Transcript_3504/g.7660  ORF Transcript_3504/g.7660 Transcript_3504/m.7660 type:complete len:386 (-) Transcript_3504:204-1361(-)